MKTKSFLNYAVLCAALTAAPVWAGDTTTDAAIGGAIGGAVGGAVGAELGGRDGAIVGAGIGAAAGAAVATKGDDEPKTMREPPADVAVVWVQPDRPNFCPPGQAKKHRC